jgi:hypothetical protein
LDKNLNQIIDKKEQLTLQLQDNENNLREEKLRVKELENKLKNHAK